MGDILALRLHINKIYNHDYGNSDRRPSLAAVMAILARLNLCSAGTNISQSQGNSGFMTLQNAQSFCASREEVIDQGSLQVRALSVNARVRFRTSPSVPPTNKAGIETMFPGIKRTDIQNRISRLGSPRTDKCCTMLSIYQAIQCGAETAVSDISGPETSRAIWRRLMRHHPGRIRALQRRHDLLVMPLCPRIDTAPVL